jgi:hypothetical protein
MDSALRQPVLSPFNEFYKEKDINEEDYCTDEDEGKKSN